MPTRTVTVGSAVGLHARPAQIIADSAGEFSTEVYLALPGEEPIEANSALLIMTLGAAHGDTVTVTSDDEVALNHIAALIEKDLDAS